MEIQFKVRFTSSRISETFLIVVNLSYVNLFHLLIVFKIVGVSFALLLVFSILSISVSNFVLVANVSSPPQKKIRTEEKASHRTLPFFCD